MTPRRLVLLFLFAAIASASAKELSGRALKEFLGPVSPSLAKWDKYIGPVDESYYGTASPPMLAKAEIFVGFMGGLESWYDLPPLVEERQFGICRLRCSKKTQSRDGQTQQMGFVDFGNTNQHAMITVTARTDADFERLLAELERLPMFNSKSPAPFHDILVRKHLSRLAGWTIIPSLFLLSLWLPQRSVRKGGRSMVFGALMFLAVCAAWILVFLSISPLPLGNLSPALFIILRASGYPLLLVLNLALLGLIAITVWLLDWCLRMAGSTTTSRVLALVGILALWFVFLYIRIASQHAYVPNDVMGTFILHFSDKWWFISVLSFACLIGAVFLIAGLLFQRKFSPGLAPNERGTRHES